MPSPLASRKPWTGGILYTHLLYGSRDFAMRAEVSKETVFNQAGHESLHMLSDAYWGLRDPDGAIFVAPTSVLLRMSLAQNVLRDRISVTNNRVDIYPTHLERLDRLYPDPTYPEIDLIGMTIYVEDSSRAAVFVKGRQISNLIRNKADDSGRESVTIVSPYRSHPLIDGREDLPIRRDTKIPVGTPAEYPYLSLRIQRPDSAPSPVIALSFENGLELSCAPKPLIGTPGQPDREVFALYNLVRELPMEKRLGATGRLSSISICGLSTDHDCKITELALLQECAIFPPEARVPITPLHAKGQANA